MGVTNLENDQEYTHVKLVAEMAVDMVLAAKKVLVDVDDPSRGYISIRVGFHSGVRSCAYRASVQAEPWA